MLEFPINNTDWEDIEIERRLPGFIEQRFGLVDPQYISKVEQKEEEVHIHIDFK